MNIPQNIIDFLMSHYLAGVLVIAVLFVAVCIAISMAGAERGDKFDRDLRGK